MENQGKRLLLAVGLALAVMLVWNLAFPPDKDDTKQSAQGSGSQVVAGAGVTGPAAPPPITTAPVAPRGPELPIVLEFPGKLTATFSNYGGALISWQLADKKYLTDPSTQRKGEMLPGRPGTGAFYVDFPRSDLKLPPSVEWQGSKISDTQVRYSLQVPGFNLEKTFTVYPEAFAVKMALKATLTVPAGTVARQQLAVSSFGWQDPTADMDGSSQVEARIWNSATMRDDEVFHTNLNALIAAPRFMADVQWAGYEHPYMLQAYAASALATENIDKYSYAIGVDGVMRTDLMFPVAMMKAGDPPIQRSVMGYLGPKSYQKLELADESAGFTTGFKDTIDFGWFAVIGKPLLWLLLKFYAFFGNWGIAIMLLTFLVKLATIYWTTKSMRSMKAMASLAPQMKALQERYKDDRQRLQAETMALYKQHSVNPIAGCLPILLQMPIWIALYRMLSSAGELYQAPFIPGWIDDLTATDPYYVLPIVLMATMFAQARLTPATGDSRQQKFLMYGMPLMFGVMSFFFPSGLTLYIFTNTVLSALHSIYMNKYDRKSLAMVAQMKKNAEAAAAKPVAGAKGAVKTGKPAAVAKPVIDVSSSSSDDDEEDDGPAAPGGAGSSAMGPGRNRPRRKKRKR